MHYSRSVAQLQQQQHRTWQRDYRAFMHMCAYYRHRSTVGSSSSSSIKGTGGGTYTPTHTPTHTHTQNFMLNIQKHLLKRKSILRMNICWRNLAVIIHKLNTINKFKFDKFSKKKTIRMLHGVLGTRVTSSMMRYCVMMLAQSRLANQGPQANQTTTTRTTFIPSTARTTAAPQRITNTTTQNKIILTIQEPRQPIPAQFYDARTNLSCANETEPQTIAIQLKPSQRLLVITAAPSTGQPKIVQVRAQQQQQPQQQRPQKQQTQTISLQQLQRARLAARSSRITRAGATAIRVPFLPGSPSTPSAVKQSSLTKKNSNLVSLTYPLRVGGLPTNNPNTITPLTSTPEVTNTATDTVYYTIVSNSASLNLNQSQNQNSEIILSSDENTTTSNYTKLCAPQQQQSLHSSVQLSQTQTQTQTQTPRTLATMAGIQLTGADEHVSPSSMSGATPTATVEEINVPVFIDEYQQQPAATTTAATTNINYSLISSNGSNANSNCDNNNSYNIIDGNEFEDFEFDMEMFEDSSNVDMFITEDKNKNNSNTTTTTTTTTTTNGGTNNMNNSVSIGLSYNNDALSNCNNTNTHNNNMYSNIDCIKNEYAEDLSQQYFITYDPLNLNDWQLSQDSTMNIDAMPDLPDISENAVDFNDFKVLDDILLSSQNPMLPSAASVCSSNNISNSQQMQINLFGNSEPFVPKIEDDDIFCVDDSTFVVAVAEPVVAEAPIISLPSVSTHKSRHRLLNKRMKVHIPTTPPIDDPLSTPIVLGGIVDLQDEKMDIESSIYLGNSVSDIGDIVESLKDNLTSPYTCTEEDSPSTPQSSYSFTTNTTPYSPAPSNISSNQQTSSNKKRRGRPAKEHSDQPDPAHLEKIPDVERKKLLDRAKNNEASRVSRRKNKVREEQEKEMERKLLEKNLVLKARRKELVKRQKKLERALMRATTFTP